VAENVAFIVCYHSGTLKKKKLSYVWHFHKFMVSWAARIIKVYWIL